MKRTLLTLLALLLVFGSAGWAARGNGVCGDGPGMGMGRHHPGMMSDRMGMGGGIGIGMLLRMADKLELTDAQKTQLEKMTVDFQTESVERRAVLEKAEIRLRAMLRDDKTSEVDAGRAIDEVTRYRADIDKMRFAHHRKVQGILTEKQLGILKELRQDRMMERRAPFMGRERDDDQDEGEDTPMPPQHPRGRGM